MRTKKIEPIFDVPDFGDPDYSNVYPDDTVVLQYLLLFSMILLIFNFVVIVQLLGALK